MRSSSARASIATALGRPTQAAEDTPGLEAPGEGRIEIGGRLVNDVAPKDRDIAMVFQSYALYPTMTVRQNITFGMECRNVPKRAQDCCRQRSGWSGLLRPPVLIQNPAALRTTHFLPL